MKNLKNIVTENKALIGAGFSMACWYGFCYLAGKGVSSMVNDHFKKHPASKGKVAVATVAAVAGAACLADFIGNLVGESIARNFLAKKPQLEVIDNNMTEETMDDTDDFEVV